MKKKTIALITFSFALTVISFNLVNGAGSGGVIEEAESTDQNPTCTDNEWSCTEWSECGSDGTQSRSCILPQCTGAQPAKPVETQSCTPACTDNEWSCSEWGECETDNKQRRICEMTFVCPGVKSNPPLEEQTCEYTETSEITSDTTNQTATQTTENCTDNEWSCTEWGKCELDGMQHRTCEMTFVCPGVKANPPAEEQPCEGLQCGHLKNMEERIECRIKLNHESPYDFIQEQAILYSPEYCRSKLDKSEEIDLKECLDIHKLLEPCWNMNDNHERYECLMRATGMNKFEEKKTACLEQEDQADCRAELKNMGKWFALASLHDILERAETLYEASRVNLKDTVELEAFIENQKMKMDEHETINNWKNLVSETQNEWKQFKEAKMK